MTSKTWDLVVLVALAVNAIAQTGQLVMSILHARAAAIARKASNEAQAEIVRTMGEAVTLQREGLGVVSEHIERLDGDEGEDWRGK